MHVTAVQLLATLQQATAAVADTVKTDSVVVESPLPGGLAGVARFLFSTVPQWIQIGGLFIGVIVAAVLAVVIWKRRTQIIAWFKTRSRAWKIGFAGVLVLVLSGAAFAGVTSWNFMMHDNGFCSGCHVMEQPFRKFTSSEHSQLGCHDCHRQGMMANVRQLYQWVAERPDRIGSHAPVPNAICAECHIQQDADSAWKRIIATAGHAIHLNERSPAMRDMQCVTCHGEEVHKFKPASETCAQSGCHDRLDIQLGKMRDQTSMHCSTCHVFTAPTLVTNPTDSARAAIVPNEQQCLECHEMRTQLRNFKPEDDPHNGVCGSCHNPHTQTSTVGAFQSCATSQCHALTDSLRAKHRSVRGHKLETCGGCHIAHTWTVGRTNCESCHSGISDPAVQVRRRPGGDDPASSEPYAHSATKPAHLIPVSSEGATHSRQTGMAFAPSPVGRVQRRSSNGEVALAQAQPRDTGAFQHARHRTVRCVTCHIGATVRSVARQCTACHHGNTAIGNNCESCHAASEIGGTHRIATNVSLSVWPAPRSRTLDFAHERHASLSCGSCHAANLSRAVEKTCASCHSEHHEATRSCSSCHPSARETHKRELHITGCGGSGCHMRETTAAITPARAVCLSCHAEQTDHKQGRECAPCHLSTWRPATGGGS